MPLYDFRCGDCGRVVEKFYRLSEHSLQKHIACEDCGGVTEHFLTIVRPPAVNSYFVNGSAGRTFTNIDKVPRTFHTEGQYRKFLKERNFTDKDL